ncbi:MAG TPA: assimilatory sulfite reductase (NADPH) flavoprotein subunit [Methylococcaceae bacterium]|nr:assimilatory sulfite reductase (NADPH) flavoprotein subunit [Methylococcaceae bacterium]
MANLLLVPVRTSRQGTSLNAGKLKADYQDETSTVEMHAEDMARLGLQKGDKIRLRAANGNEAVVKCKAIKGDDATPGLMFMAYGPNSSQLMDEDTGGTGMPLSKHLPVEVEGPLEREGGIQPPAALSSSPLSPAQAGFLSSLLTSALSPVQAAWLSGYFAAMSGGAAAMPSFAPQASNLPLMTILFGSQTGNGEGLANDLAAQAQAKGYNVNLMDMADYDPARIAEEKLLFVVVSTHGEGDPPIAAEKLHAYLHGDGAPRLENLKYAVFALGDSSYQYFCKTGKDFDRFLENLGAQRLLGRVDADVDFEEPAAQWLENVQETYQSLLEEAGAAPTGAKVLEFPAKAKNQYGKTNPYPAAVLVNVNLNGEGSAKQTCHMEIDLGDSGITFEPGDALGVYPRNNPVYVDALLSALKMDGATEVAVGKETLSLREAFSGHLDVTALSRNVIEKYADVVHSDGLRELLAEANSEGFRDYTWGRHILDLVEDHPVEGVSPQDFVNILRRIPARLYSIASSLTAHPNQVHLIVAAVRYQAHNRDREGVCSTFLAGRIGAEEKLPIYVQPNKNFRLPADPEAPLIMVGPGTGVAPFRAFVEEREATGATGKNWLFFGDQHRATDYLYGEEWEDKLARGVLTRLDLAFSRDQAQKIYVQTRMLENSREIYAWLEEGGHFYVCGDATRMAHDVHQALIEIASKEGGMSREMGESYVNALAESKRYLRDVY